MQSAETVLDVLRERGRRGLSCDELYRQLFNPQLFLLAYGRIYSNKGAMTPGAGAVPCPGFVPWPGQPPGRRAMPSEGIEGDEWDAYVTLSRTARTNMGSPVGREPYGDSGLI